MLPSLSRRTHLVGRGAALALTAALVSAVVIAAVVVVGIVPPAADSGRPAGARSLLATLQTLGAAWRGGSGSTLDVVGTVPTFTLVDQFERPVSTEDLRGRVVLADFVYTTCTESCPLLSSRMQAVQGRLRQQHLLGGRVQLLSFSVDPARDTPAVLRAYAERYDADPDGWRFLTGPEKYVLPLVVQGFRLGVQQVPLPSSSPGTATYDTMHSNRVVLVDTGGRIRAYYDGLALDVEQVMRNMRALVR